MDTRLAADTSTGAVTLRVADLDAMIRYYTRAVPLQLLSHEGSRAVIGRGTRPVLILEHAPELRQASPGQAGLLHTAILFDREAALAAAVRSVATHAPRTFTGSADHLDLDEREGADVDRPPRSRHLLQEQRGSSAPVQTTSERWGRDSLISQCPSPMTVGR
ncbi:hypothetical protein [Microbacterium sp. H1-D42]|uniref:hypothetical protein n=1 Tax=Microbacterium sp. H1-D42 TaxID=2925844 RepID=UPI00321FD37F